MGGPWKERGFDPVAWQPPKAREARTDAVGGGSRRDDVSRIVVTYVVALLMSVGVMVSLMMKGW